MKNMLFRFKWIFGEIKTYIPYIFIIVIIGSISSILGVYKALSTKWIFDAATSSNIDKLYHTLIIFATIILSSIALQALSTIIQTRCSVGILNSLQQKLYSRIIKTKWMDFLKYHSGDYLTRITSDIQAVTSMIINTIPSCISLAVLLIGSFFTIAHIDLFLAVIIILLFPITFPIARFYSKKIRKIYLKNQEIESKYRSFLNESIQNMLIVKTFCLLDTNINIVRKIQKDRFKLVLDSTKLSIMSTTSMSISSWVGFFLVFLWGALKIKNGTVSFGTLMALIQLIGNIQAPLAGLASSLPHIIRAVASTERLMEIENQEIDTESLITEEISSVGLIFEQVGFQYKKSVPVLTDISVEISPGETVALVGPSGEGKTTFLHLLLALISPTKGHLYINDESNKIEISAATRKFISYVPQGNTLFSGTIAENLRLGNPSATDEQLENAVKAACAWEFIMDLPEGLNTVLSERGVGLSEGQAQRIAIARALLHKVPILLLDEATSALDSETEIKVLERIQNLNPTPTCIIITHRNTALKICDRVFKLEHSYIVEQDSLNYKDIVVDVI